MRRWRLCLFAIAGIACCLPWAVTAEPPSDDEKSTAAEKKVIQAATEHIARFKMRLADASGDIVEPVDRPLLAYGEPARANNHGTLWAFGTRGRPVAFIELWQAADNEALWFQSVVRTGDPSLRLDLSDGKRWRPPEGKIARTAIKNAPRPSATKPARLRQLKSLARQFTAHEFWGSDNSRAELRLLVQPVHRYDDAPAGLQDGAAFIFAHGTNPEIILLLEALGPAADQSRWHFSAFPTSSAQAHVEIDGHEVWTRPAALGVVGLPTDDYWLFSLPAIEPRSPADFAAPNEKE